MNYIFHIMLVAAGAVLRVHYKSIKCNMFQFLLGSVSKYLGEVDIFSYMSEKLLPFYNSEKIIKIDRDFPKLSSQMHCHLFYGSQCRCLYISVFICSWQREAVCTEMSLARYVYLLISLFQNQ